MTLSLNEHEVLELFFKGWRRMPGSDSRCDCFRVDDRPRKDRFR